MLYQSQSALYGMCSAVWDGFRMADVQLSCNNCWFSSQQSVNVASNTKKKYKSCPNIINPLTLKSDKHINYPYNLKTTSDR